MIKTKAKKAEMAGSKMRERERLVRQVSNQQVTFV